MRKMVSARLEEGRVRRGRYATTSRDGLMGAFKVRGPCGADLVILSSGPDAKMTIGNWEHVSVSLAHRTPNWTEMSWIKDLFWDDDEAVLQFHPPKREYVNLHPYCLHLWRPLDGDVRVPPSSLMGPML
jgi:hypothetical protein